MGLVKAIIVNMDETPVVNIPVMFNPPQLNIRKVNNYTKIKNPKKDESDIVFLQGDNDELSLELFFDSTDLAVDVRVFTDKIVGLTKIKEGSNEPPRLMFIWGPMSYDCKMTGVSQKYEQFNNKGQALRALLNITLIGFDKMADKRSNSGSALNSESEYTVKEGDSVVSIAAKTTGDPQSWKSIASANNIRNPLTIPSGTSLKIL